ncbi:hypothetical protein [Pendulispora albinea]|uniref:Uncharacterized protein n=1 Tax=Pendulispora albinea TaxID=2741071 RepID=A0ABZ2M9P6_9BACT
MGTLGQVPLRRPFIRSIVLALTTMTCGACVMSWDPTATQGADGLNAGRKIRGTVSGLAGKGLVLTSGPNNDVTVEPGATSFEIGIGKGQSYTVSVKSSPHSPVQDCVVANSVGTLRDGDDDVTNVVVVCTTLGYTVNADVSGLVGSLTLANGSDTLLVRENGVHSFAPSRRGQPYTVTVATQPPTQRCLVATGSGVMDTADVRVPIWCLDSFLESFDDAPDLPVGWKVAILTASGSTLWYVSQDNADSSPNCARVRGSANTLDTALVSPQVLILSNQAQIRFRHAYESEALYDGGVLEIQIQGGPFVDIVAAGGTFSSAGYTGVIGTLNRPPLMGRSAWTGKSGGYVTTVVNLPPNLPGKSIALRWRWGNDGSSTVPNAGWSIDNVIIHR